MSLDILHRIKDKVNSLNSYTTATVGMLDADESISILAMPGGAEKEYMDGVRDKDYQMQINAKSQSQAHCFNSLTEIYQALENLYDLPSNNGSYDFNKIETKSLPSIVSFDEQGFYIFALSISAKITIYEGNVVNE